MPPRTRLSAGLLSGARSFRPLPKLGSGNWYTAKAVASPVHRPACARSEGTQTRLAICTWLNTLGKLPPSRTGSGTPAGFSGTTAGARPYTTCWGVLSQPDKQEPASRTRTIGLGLRQTDRPSAREACASRRCIQCECLRSAWLRDTAREALPGGAPAVPRRITTTGRRPIVLPFPADDRGSSRLR
jgi:hypothetical protein